MASSAESAAEEVLKEVAGDRLDDAVVQYLVSAVAEAPLQGVDGTYCARIGGGGHSSSAS